MAIGEGRILSEDADYSNDGNYGRIGADVNFLTKDPDKNMFFFGYTLCRVKIFRRNGGRNKLIGIGVRSVQPLITIM